MSKFTIRSALTSEVDQLLQAAEEFFYEGEFRSLTFDRECYRNHLLNYLSDISSDVISAWDEDTLCGYVIIFCTREYTKENVGDQYQFYVRPDYRGTGVSRLLVDAAEKRFDDWNCAISHTAADPRLDKHPKNNSLFCNLWAKFGYKTTGVLLTKERRIG